MTLKIHNTGEETLVESVDISIVFSAIIILPVTKLSKEKINAENNMYKRQLQILKIKVR